MQTRSASGGKSLTRPRSWTSSMFMTRGLRRPAGRIRNRLPDRLGLKRFADFGQELLDLERLEQHRCQSFLAGADDAVIRIIAEAGHQDDRGRRLPLSPGGGEHVV